MCVREYACLSYVIVPTIFTYQNCSALLCCTSSKCSICVQQGTERSSVKICHLPVD